MKTYRLWNVAMAGALLAGLSGASAAWAQPTNRLDRPQARGPRGFAAGPGAGRFAPGLERLFGVLTDEQKASLRKAMDEQRERMAGIEEKLRVARKEIFEAGLGKNFDEEAVRTKAMAAAKLDAELTVLRAKAFSEMRPTLSGEQLSKLRSGSEDSGEIRGERPRRAEPQRDENGLPPKK